MNANNKARTMILEILDKIVTEYQPEKVILFGSYAYGNPDNDSDIDLLIIKNTNERPIDRWVHMCRIASDPERRIPFEPIVLTKEELQKRIEIGDQFISEILEKGEVLYGT